MLAFVVQLSKCTEGCWRPDSCPRLLGNYRSGCSKADIGLTSVPRIMTTNTDTKASSVPKVQVQEYRIL